MSVSFSNIQDGGGVNGNIDELPVFTNADQNDYSLPVGSGCIDAGRNEELPLHIGTDLVGNPRVADGDASGTAVTDIGAVEYPVACDADWNNVGGLNSQDFFDFLNDFFTMEADFNTDGVTNSQDFFDFLAAFFTGC